MVEVSVILPVFNAEKTLEKCLKALLVQTFKDFEVICINDGSSDNSINILEKYAKLDTRIKVFSQVNSGPALTRFNAIEKSLGDYLMFCDADDWYEPKMIEKMYNTIKKKNVDIVMCDCNIIDLANGELQNYFSKKYHKNRLIGYKTIDLKSIKHINAVLWNKIFKKEILEQNSITYPCKYEHDDLIFVYKYCLFSNKYFGLREKLYNYVVGNSDSIMGKVYTQNNKKNPFDFILAWQDLYDFMNNKNIPIEKRDFLINKQYNCIKTFYYHLDNSLKEKAFICLKNFVEKNDFLLENSQFNKVISSNSFEYFHENITKRVLPKVSLLEHFFSLKNYENHKILRILGLKIKFRLK